jgi:hypothetical protein
MTKINKIKSKSRCIVYSNRGSVAFEYVIVTIFGVGLSLLIMSTAKQMITEKLEAFKESIDNNLNIVTPESSRDEHW